METITNAASTVASTVSKTIWGEQETTTHGTETARNETAGAEPISGEQGKGTVTEPFDKGNAEDINPPSSTSEIKPVSHELSSASPLTSTQQNPTSDISDTKTGPMATIGTDSSNTAAGDNQVSLGNTEHTGVTENKGLSGHASEVTPLSSTHPGVAPTFGAQSETKYQGSEVPGKVPSAVETTAIKEKKSEAEAVLANKEGSNTGVIGGSRVGEEGGKTTGLAADGGNFDATKPGAGKEADRLLEQKDTHKKEPGQSSAQHSSGTTHTGEKEKGKVSLGEKIKNKLHIGHHDK